MMKYRKNIKKILAFTLAELLLAMSIVGIVAAIILPAIRNLAPNREMIMFKKAYGVFTRVVNEMINNEELYPEAIGTTTGTGFANTTEVTYRGITASGNKKFCVLFAAHMNPVGEVSCAANQYSFKTADGIEWDMPVTSFATDSGNFVFIDVDGQGNGADKEGVDIFKINLKRDGIFYFDGSSAAVAKKYLQESDLSKSAAEIK